MSGNLPMPPLSLEPGAAHMIPMLGADIGMGMGGAQAPMGFGNRPVVVAGKYAVGGVIGVGTYGEVRYAVALATGERVAIKIVDLARFSAGTAGLLRKEIRILRMLGKHPHTIRIIDVHENVPFEGRWCEACACTCFKHMPTTVAPGAAQPASDTAHRGPIRSTSLCGVCNHSAAEHSGVSYGSQLPYGAIDEDEGETRQVMLIVQELCAGGELFALLSHSGPLPEDVARLYFQQLISGVQHLHSLNIAHRDLKPENLVIDDNFVLKLADFGLASLGTPVLTHDNTTLALSQQLADGHVHHSKNNSAADSPSKNQPDIRHYSGVGSQPYSAPEVYYARELGGGRGYRGPPCDVWSAAVILFVMLTGRPPFVRPLAKTYGNHMRRCRHFIAIMAGNGLDMLHPLAKDLLQKMFKLVPSERLTVAQIQSHPWVLGPTPSQDELSKIMHERSMRSWSGSHHPEMTHVLSKMRSSKLSGEIPSLSGTPHFGSQSVSASPTLEPTTLHSPSFTSASVPPSPYVLGHPLPITQTVRSRSPDSREQKQSSDTAYPHGRSAGFLNNNNSAMTSSSFFETHAAVPAHPLAPSMHSTLSTLLHPGVVPELQASFLQMGLHNDNNNDAQPVPVEPEPEEQESRDEVPPALPEIPMSPTNAGANTTLSEYDRLHEIQVKLKLAAATAAAATTATTTAPASDRRDHPVSLPSKRSHTMCRMPQTPPACSVPAPPLPPSLLLLASSLSFPPRSEVAHFVSTMEYMNLLELLKTRLEKRGARVSQLPPRGAHSSVHAHLQHSMRGLLESGEECLMHVSATFCGAPLILLLSIRSVHPLRGAGAAASNSNSNSNSRKGYLVLAEKVRASDPFVFQKFFDSISAGLRQE